MIITINRKSPIPALLPIQGLDDFQELLSEIQFDGQLFNAEV